MESQDYVKRYTPISHQQLIIEFERLGDIDNIQKRIGFFTWDKWSGEAEVRLSDGRIVRADLHWYQDRFDSQNRQAFKVSGILEFLDETLYEDYTKSEFDEDFSNIFYD